MWDNVIVIFEVFIRPKRPKLTLWGRLFFVSLLRLNERVLGNIVTISPNTVLAWNRKLAARRWTFRQKPLGRPVTEDDVRNLVIEMKTNNPRWGARRIVGELRKLSKSISKSTVLNILIASGFPSGGSRQDQSWYRFLRSHGQRFFACDFCPDGHT